jgi:hypothetical protein
MVKNDIVRRTLCAVALSALCSGAAFSQAVKGSVRIGTYDSRAVALAFYNTDEFRQTMSGMMAELEKAKSAKDDKRVKELESQGPFMQARMHWQVFSNLSVPNIIDRIKDAIPGIAKDAGVSAIVSKWELVYTDESIECVDVTPRLVKLFNPNEKVLKWIEDGSNQDPIPLEKLPPESEY